MVTVNEEIKSLRADIDRLDQEILKILKQRIRITEEIGKIKKTNSLDIIDKQRESEILSNLLAAGENLEIEDDFIISLWRQIIDYSNKIQNDCE